MDIRLGDILLMKKQHPCGSRRWLVLRTGADFRLRCEGCVQRPQEKPFDSAGGFSPEKEGGK